MSVLAFSAVSLTNTMDSSQDQYRYERAQNQVAVLKKAIIDRVETQQVVRGFVADVGVLPANMAELAFGVVDKDPTHELILASSSQQPIYDFTPDAEGFNNGDGILLTTSLNLVKGFRGAALQTDEGSPRNFYIGSYLTNLLPGKNIYDGLTKPRFDDGWGNQNGSFSTTLTVPASNALSLDDQTHGWVWNYDGNLSISTFGKDGVSGGTEYSEDLLLASISPDDWSVTPSDIQVELYNDLANLNLVTQYAFVILAFNAKRDLWQTVVSASFQIPQVGQIATASFPSYLSTFRVPAGQHVLMLIENSGNHLTPISSVTEKIPGTDSNPEVQTLVLSPEPAPAPNRVKLSITLPDPSDPNNSITEESLFRQTITAAISDLNSDFVNAGFNSDPITFSGNNSSGNLTIELSESSSGQLNNENVSMMTVTRESIPNTYRAKHIHVLPGQANIFRLNLSSIAP